MQDLALTRSYDRSAAPPEHAVKAGAPLRTDRMLNYVWINKTPDRDLPPPADDTPLCSVPLHYLDRAYDNARKYPNTEMRIWMDEARLSDRTRFFVQSHAYLNAPGNVRFKDLNSIPAYAAARDIHMDAKISMWDKVDLARFQVAAHGFTDRKVQTVYYADFDVRDVALDNEQTKKILEKRDIAFARLPRENIVSHGYFAVRAKGLPLLEKLICKFEDAVRDGGHIFTTLHMNLPFSYHFTLRGKVIDIDIPPQGTKMSRPDLYKETGLCGFEFK